MDSSPLRAGLFLLAAVVLAACHAPASAYSPWKDVETRANLESPSWGLGAVTPPHTIFTFKQADGLPAYCADPDAMLQALYERIRSDEQQNNCKAAPPTLDVDFALSLKFSCVLRTIDDAHTDQPRCQDVYLATIWPERVETSTVRYRLQSFSWARRVCFGTQKGTFNEMEQDLQLARVTTQSSQRLNDFFATCTAPLSSPVPPAEPAAQPPASGD